MRLRSMGAAARSVTVAVVVTGLVLAGCGGDDGDDGATGTTSSTPTALDTTTTDPGGGDLSGGTPTTTEAESVATTTPDDEDGDPGPAYAPGESCPLGQGVADCIDPDGDGQGTLLVGGDECVATTADIDLCVDNNGDGSVAEPDGEGRPLPGEPGYGGGETGDLPLCGDGIPLPCRNPDGSVPEPGTDETSDLPTCGDGVEPPCVLPDGAVVEPSPGE